MRDSIKQALLGLPVSINCYYGDPTLQWEDTMAKLKVLEAIEHNGPVSIITKGHINPQRATELAALNLPGLLVMVSISELSKEIEGIGHAHRYQSLANLRDAGVCSMAAVRPLTPPHNTTEEVITRIFQRLQGVGCRVACVSGFRGDESLVAAMQPDAKIEWVLRVKQMTGFDHILQAADQNGVRLFTRVACAVSYLTGSQRTYNPYWGSPQLVRCGAIDCPMRDTCGPVEPNSRVMGWLRQVGYEVEYQPNQTAACGYSSDNRLNCKSCCTTCYVQQQPRVVVHNARTLGDLTFCRFMLGGTLCIKQGMVDGGSKDVGHVTKLQEQTNFAVHCINSWFVWANQLDTCFGCKYCVSKLYSNSSPVGCAPVHLLEYFPPARALAD